LAFHVGSLLQVLPGEKRSAAAKFRLSLLDVGSQAFLGVCRAEELGLQLALEGEPLLEPDLEPRGDGTLDGAYGEAGLVRLGEAVGVFHGAALERFGRGGFP